jgi:crossover junction endodeoxyribonuclease RuvC
MRILGIDPGLATMGFGVIESVGGRLAMVRCGVITTTPDKCMPDRLLLIGRGIDDLLSAYKPDEIAFEELFFARNVTTALSVGAARGVALCTCARYSSNLYEYTPMQIKQAVVGYGKAEKGQVQNMVRLLLGLADIPRPDDAADAVAVAITHANTGRAKGQFLIK